MLQKDSSNTIFHLAADLVNHTSQHIFLTGKAGTGKTTFLRHITAHSKKNAVVVAPTGVAAINAGGVTMHSFFQLPRGMFIPGIARREGLIGYTEATDKHSLFKNIHFTSNKRQLLQEMELLVIDEVSMMRCDMLDAIDTILRHFRKAPHLPFGGVQTVYIGDLFQLPPVVSNEEWKVLQEYYQSPFFFSAKVIAEAPPLYIELKKIYRQNEQEFIDVLNRIRNNNPGRDDFDFLNKKFQPDFIAPQDEHYITITTHNKKADIINANALAKLPGRLHSFKAVIKDEFTDKSFPTEVELQLKEGAQVMFIKNDSSAERRYFNGKIGTVKKLVGEEITVSFDDGSEDLVLEKETWQNIRYIYNRENDDIDEEVLGSFTQFPIRLAWAITVHKSQGLTFNKAVIDAGASFAPGQVYVALSRCTSLEGLALKSRIYPSSISTDSRIIEFARREVENTKQLEAILEREKYKYWGRALVKVFDWSKIVAGIYQWMQIIPEKKLPDNQASLRLAQSLLVKARQQSEIARKFQRQLENILLQVQIHKDTSLLEESMKKAVGFFAGELTTNILSPLQQHITDLFYTTKISKYKEELKQLEGLIWAQVQKLLETRYGDISFDPGISYRQFDPLFQKNRKETKGREPKGASQNTSFALFKSGKTVAEIAEVRNMATSTIESHLAMLVRTGDLDATELIGSEKLQCILKMIDQIGSESIGLIKNGLGEEYSYHEIRVALNHLRYRERQSA